MGYCQLMSNRPGPCCQTPSASSRRKRMQEPVPRGQACLASLSEPVYPSRKVRRLGGGRPPSGLDTLNT